MESSSEVCASMVVMGPHGERHKVSKMSFEFANIILQLTIERSRLKICDCNLFLAIIREINLAKTNKTYSTRQTFVNYSLLRRVLFSTCACSR